MEGSLYALINSSPKIDPKFDPDPISRIVFEAWSPQIVGKYPAEIEVWTFSV